MHVCCRFCTLHTPFCAEGRYLFKKFVDLDDTISSRGFVHLPQEIKERIHQQYEMYRQQYFDHIGHH